MSLGLIGTKLGMTRVFDDKGVHIPVTVIHVAGNQVVQTKTKEKEGYDAVQIGYKEKIEQRETQPMLGHFKKHGVTPKYRLREFRLDEAQFPQAGALLGPEIFAVGSFVDVTGTTKGRGFQGVVKRFGFRGQPASHGSMMHRRPGSIGCRSTPGLVWKNKKMPGHMGNVRRTTQSLEVIQSRPEEGVILVKGCVPGHNGSYLTVRPALRASAKKAAKK
jgi:large subunit ribosomal protein L3